MNNIKVVKNYIGGKRVEAECQDQLDIENPSTGEIIGEVPLRETHNGKRNSF